MNKVDAVLSFFGVNGKSNGPFIPVRCKFHDDNKPSAYLIFNESKNGGWYKCRTCHESMSIFTLIERLGIQYEANESTEEFLEESGHTRQDLLSANRNDFVKFSNEHIAANPKRFPSNLTYDNLLDGFEQYLQEKQISMDTIKHFGGVHCTTVGDPYYGYLVFEYGRVVKRRIGRRVCDNLNLPRFLNSEAKDEKSKGLFNEEVIRKYSELFLVEGITDLFTLFQLDIRNVICSFGASLSKDQAYLLRRKTVFTIYNTDMAGFEGARQAAERLKAYDAIPIILEIPDYFWDDKYDKIDINTAYCKDKDKLKQWLDETVKKYSTYDENYSFGNQEDSREYETSIPIFKFTQGLYGITAEEGVGKTTVAVHILDELISSNPELTALYCNYELTKKQLWCRLASRYCNYTWVELESDKAKRKEVEYLLADKKKRVRVTEHITLEEVQHMVARGLFKLIVFDYLQVIPRPEIKDDRLKIEYNMGILAKLAQAGAIIIFISEMPVESFDKNRKHVFKGSGRIPYALDAGFILKREIDDGGMHITHTKNRRGKFEYNYVHVDYAHQRLELKRG